MFFVGPVKTGVGFIMRHLGVPVYRLTFFVRRNISRILRPAKHQFLFLFSNRYSFHSTIIVLILVVSALNIGAQDVRAETFGQKSLLYDLTSSDGLSSLEVVEASDTVQLSSRSGSYLSDTFINEHAHIDIDFIEEEYVTPSVGIEGVEPTTRPVVPKRDSVETYVVKEGDNLSVIAESYGLSLSTLLWSNNLTLSSTIRPGQELSILPTDGVLYTVRSGDTLSRIARRFDVSIDEVVEENNMQDAHKLAIGDKLLLPGGEPPSVAPRRSASVANLFSPSAGGGSSWVWPSDWRVITQYYGWRHTGLDVDGDYSTYSYASRDGRVIYSGWRSGYGLTVEIDHGDGYTTRYAHHSKNFVSYGEYVAAGQAIAQTGSTGRSTGTHLHFEIIKGGRFYNPLEFLR